MEVDPSITEKLNAIWLTPYGISAKYIFIGGAIFMFFLMIKRHKMSAGHAALALVGFKPVLNRDIWFNLLHALVIAIPITLLVIAIKTSTT